jgi:hypothetical protein
MKSLFCERSGAALSLVEMAYWVCLPHVLFKKMVFKQLVIAEYAGRRSISLLGLPSGSPSTSQDAVQVDNVVELIFAYAYCIKLACV